MNRKNFIKSNGAECRNWIWSWSFVNHKEKFVIFGAWKSNKTKNGYIVFSKDWERKKGRKQAAYNQSLKHIRLVKKEGYKLKIFIMEYSENDAGTVKIKSFERELIKKSLKKIDNDWYAFDSK